MEPGRILSAGSTDWPVVWAGVLGYCGFHGFKVLAWGSSNLVAFQPTYYIISYSTILSFAVLYVALLYSTLLHSTLLYYTIP
eukprot:16213254-Heterocapsa_arctica.AAC.1